MCTELIKHTEISMVLRRSSLTDTLQI